MIYLISTLGLLKVRALLSPLLPFLPCQDREKRSKYDRKTTCVDWRGKQLTLEPVLCCVACQQRGFRKAICSFQQRLCPRYQQGVSTRMREEKALFMLG